MSGEFTMDDFVFMFGPIACILILLVVHVYTDIDKFALYLVGGPIILIALFYFIFKNQSD